MDDNRWEDGRRGPVAEPPLSIEELKALVCGFVSYPTVYKAAKQIGFMPALFNGRGEAVLATFMAFYTPLYENHGTVTKNMFVTHLTGMLNSGTFVLAPEVREQLLGEDGFIELAFIGVPEAVEDARAERHYIQSILRRFMNARLVADGLKTVLSATAAGTAPTEMVSSLDRFRKQAQAIKFVGNEAVNAAVMPMPGEKIILPPVARPTTISWIDNYIGGIRSGDVIGLLGPYAGGKTTMMSTIITRMAQQYAAHGENKLAVYICYEDGAEKMNWMFYSAAAHIHRDRFKNKVDSAAFWADLSTRENLRPYERHIPVNHNGEIILSETERWTAAAPWLNRHFTFLDFSASANTNYRGNGGVAEVVATLENLCDATGMEIGIVGIDYTSLMINRELSQNPNTKHVEQVWRQVQQLPDELKTHVAIPFGTTIFLAHQLAQGDIKSIPPHRHVSHADAQGSKSFGENVHACLCLNRPDPETYVSTINWSKIRFERPACGPFGLVKIDENVVDVLNAEGEYYINDIARKIMRKGEAGPVAGTQAETSRPGRRLQQLDRAAQPDIDTGFLS